jgi:hypothetical protein
MEISEKDWEKAIKKANEKIDILAQGITNRRLVMPIINYINSYNYGNRSLELYNNLIKDL